MELVTIKQLTFAYPTEQTCSLDSVSLSIKQGEFITLCGYSGSGKSTLLRHLKPALAPYGQQSGHILYEGAPLIELSPRRQAAEIGFVQQHPENQLVTDKVWHELAFGLESLGTPTSEIRLRVAETASFFGIEPWFHRDANSLSGGQKQLVCLASVMAMQPKLLLLDEPTSQLDPIAAAELLSVLRKINRQLGVTVLLSEQRLDETLPHSDRVVVMEHGRIVVDAPPKQAGLLLKEKRSAMLFAMPAPMQIYAAVDTPFPSDCPISVREGRLWLDQAAQIRPLLPLASRETVPAKPPALTMKNVWFRYEKHKPDVLKGLSLSVPAGQIYALLGGNGAGKSTVLRMLSGLSKPYRGTCNHTGKLALLPQDPCTLFTQKTALLDLQEITTDQTFIDETARRLSIDHLLHRHPYDLSGGEQQRLALAKVLLQKPNILLLDEPTKGLDGMLKQTLGTLLRSLCKQGITVFMVSHDVEFCAQHAHGCALLFDGQIISQAAPRPFFSGNNFYTTAASRMARSHLPQAITAEDVIKACGSTALQPKKEPPPTNCCKQEDGKPLAPVSPPPKPPEANKPKQTAAILVTALVLLLLVPATVLFGVYVLGDRKYYFISLLLIVYAMVPFVLRFERRRPQAREVVTIATLTALATIGRVAFFLTPQFKPITAIIILSGVALGAESGFVIGLLSAFVSNFFFGQGPWTPWQMFCWGAIGCLAGLLFGRSKFPSVLQLCLFGGASSLLLYGGLMNPASVLMFQASPTWQAVLTSYAAGLPFDLVHAASTILFLWLFATPMLEKLRRLQTKYGVYHDC